MHLRPRRGLPALAVLALLTLPLAACAATSVSGVGATMTSPPRESVASGEDAPSDGSDGSTDEGALPELPLPDVSIPDLTIPEELGVAEDCVAVLETYAGLAASAIGGPEAAADARARAEELKASLPEDLHDDIDVIADAYAGIAENGFLDGLGALDDPEFGQANENISTYLQENCGGA